MPLSHHAPYIITELKNFDSQSTSNNKTGMTANIRVMFIKKREAYKRPLTIVIDKTYFGSIRISQETDFFVFSQ